MDGSVAGLQLQRVREAARRPVISYPDDEDDGDHQETKAAASSSVAEAGQQQQQLSVKTGAGGGRGGGQKRMPRQTVKLVAQQFHEVRTRPCSMMASLPSTPKPAREGWLLRRAMVWWCGCC